MRTLVGSLVASVTQWWRQPDHFDALSAYLMTRGLQTIVRLTVVNTTIFLVVVSISMQWSRAGSWRPAGMTVALAAAALSLVTALMWSRRWPNRWQSKTFLAVSDIDIALACLSYRDALIGLVSCVMFAVLGGYIAFFHSPRILLAHLGFAVSTTATLATLYGFNSGDWIAAFCMFAVTSAAVSAAPLATQVLVHRLATDVAVADVDPLCGLLNRRGFYRRSRDLLSGASRVAAPYLAVSIVDLDQFKRLNDALGHAVGDRVLVAVGEILRTNHNGAMVARIGGEEFLVAEIADRPTDAQSAEKVRQAIADLPFGVTASIGVVSAEVPLRSHLSTRALIDEMIRCADAAMYDAKQRGGNQIRHRRASLRTEPTDLVDPLQLDCMPLIEPRQASLDKLGTTGGLTRS